MIVFRPSCTDPRVKIIVFRPFSELYSGHTCKINSCYMERIEYILVMVLAMVVAIITAGLVGHFVVGRAEASTSENAAASLAFAVLPMPEFKFASKAAPIQTGLQGFGEYMYITQNGASIGIVNGTAAPGQGSVDLFGFSGTALTPSLHIENGFPNDRFGFSGAASPDSKWLAFGASGAARIGTTVPKNSGVVHTYNVNGALTSLVNTFQSPEDADAAANNNFGSSLAFSSNSTELFVRSNNTDKDNLGKNQLWIYSLINGNTWTFRDFVEVPSDVEKAPFGNVVASANSSIFFVDQTSSGKTYADTWSLYVEDKGAWIGTYNLTVSGSNSELVPGGVVSASGTIAAKASVNPAAKTVNNVNIAFRTNEIWAFSPSVLAGFSTSFGNSLAMTENGGYLAVGEPEATSMATANVGRVFVYRRTATNTYENPQEITLPTGEIPLAADIYFGRSLTFAPEESGTAKLVIGAPGANGGIGAAAVYTMTLST